MNVCVFFYHLQSENIGPPEIQRCFSSRRYGRKYDCYLSRFQGKRKGGYIGPLANVSFDKTLTVFPS